MPLTFTEPRTQKIFSGKRKEIRSFVDLSNGLTLRISTSRSLRGGFLESVAQVGRTEVYEGRSFFNVRLGVARDGDFHHVAYRDKRRATAKAIEQAHEQGLAGLPSLMPAIAAYYARDFTAEA